MRDGMSRVFRDPGSLGAVNCVSLSPDGNHVAAAHEDRVVRIWDLRAGQLVRTLSGHTNWVRSVAFMPDGKGLVSGGEDNTSKWWDMSPLRTLRQRRKNSLKFREGSRAWSVRISMREGRTVSLELTFLGHKVWFP
jgi:WD40 repeat protein